MNTAYDTMLSMISAVILTHNSEQTLIPTLESLSWSDERIVIDDESIDKTVVIAKKFKTGSTVKVLHKNQELIFE